MNLDQAVEGSVQDRWYQLGGSDEDTGEVHVRLAVVAGSPEGPAAVQMMQVSE